jgi:muramoyltetrapeptide carboxypeptidase
MKKTADSGIDTLLPPPLKKGDTIGLVAPAGPVREQEPFTDGIRLLREMGFQVKYNRDLIASGEGYLAAADRERADDFNHLWADEEVKALLCVRGGYGCLRIIEMLDMELIRQQPKMLIGYSDITVLLNVICRETGLVTFHGPVLSSLTHSDSHSIDVFFQTLTGRPPSALKPDGLEILLPGNATGTLRGGNLATLVHLLGTPFEISWDNSLLIIEDIGEAPYRVDRMLTQLKKAARLDRLSGLILGTFTDETAPGNGAMDYEAVWNRTLELVGEQKIPVWANFPAGHTPRNTMLPLGIEAEMHSTNGTLNFLGPCTS